MIPSPFGYLRPESKQEALTMLAGTGEVRPLAGGHSIIPMMKLRMAAPDKLVDISSLNELIGIEVGPAIITIGASTTQHDLIASADLFKVCPIIRETSELIADPQIRYFGTLGGNVGNGDPGNDMPGLMKCLDAAYVIESVDGVREVKARDFYEAAYFTALQTGELITAVKIPCPAAGHGYAYTKLKRKVGDYATAAAAVVLEMTGGTVRDCSIALTNVGDTPLFAAAAVDALKGGTLSEAEVDAAVAAAEAIAEPAADGRGSVEYRTKMAGVMVRRAIALAQSRAGEAAPRPTPPPAPPAAPPPAAPEQSSSEEKKGGLFSWLKS
ncbi:MAG: xanthine dehydrogenase family protein subunit M [Pseudomonadota bacterium]